MTFSLNGSDIRTFNSPLQEVEWDSMALRSLAFYRDPHPKGIKDEDLPLLTSLWVPTPSTRTPSDFSFITTAPDESGTARLGVRKPGPHVLVRPESLPLAGQSREH